ncbi:hypothetical protein [Superficieibacter sp. HKU1]|uniref:hypothetical protein n=1 Tax=Superficieibacter sp. HKU1 TaxID=3031919 RepID=UPI0023E1F771|nr:hypothetical protein [Superficieibacter sp. HKU1]WES69657.1 hypothetical protein P0H77_06610 [Superficieibacter sp. HKU1]
MLKPSHKSRIPAAMKSIEQASAVLIAISHSVENMEPCDISDAIDACSGLINPHPAEIDVEAMLSREHAYPDSFTLAERKAERLTRARLGISHVMTELIPLLDDDKGAEIYCWLNKVLTLVDIAIIDEETKV